MVWFKVDDQLPVSKKFHRLPPDLRLPAMGLWVIVGAWCSGQENDGIVPDHMVHAWGGTDELAAALVKAGFWKPHDADPDDPGYEYHDWDEWQPTADELEEKRRQGRERVAKAREKKRLEREALERQRQQEEDAERNAGVTRYSRESNAGVTTTPTRPDPTRPDPTTESSTQSGDDGRRIAAQVRTAFDSVWQFWPRQEHKQEALVAFSGAVRKLGVAKATLAVKQHGEAYAASGRAQQFIPGLARWLEAERWEEPLVSPEKEREWLTPAERNVRKIEAEREAMARGEKTEVQAFLSSATSRKEIGA